MIIKNYQSKQALYKSRDNRILNFIDYNNNMKGNENLILGENSYQGVIEAIRNKMASTRTCDTILGNDLLGKAYQKLNESTTPILDLKEFTTNAEQIAPDDTTLREIVDFCKKHVHTGDYNFLINLCKEEHFQNLGRAYHPSPESTINAFKNMFDTTGSALENAIKNGIFDSLKSNLLKILKSELSPNEQQMGDQPLNESMVNADKSLVKYSPVGIRYEDLKNNKVVHLMEHDVMSFNTENGECTRLGHDDIVQLDITPSYRRMMTALNGLQYNPLNESFTLNENWDFECKLHDGECFINNKPIKKDELRQLLLESINTYEMFPAKVQNFNKTRYMMDADNMIMLLENFDKIVKYDNLEVIKSLNERDATYVILDKAQTVSGSTPRVIASSNHDIVNKLFESYEHMTSACKEVLGSDITPMFESQIKTEHEVYRQKNERIITLRQEIVELNENIEKLDKIMSIADEGSPSSLEAGRRKLKLNECLNDRINQLANIDKEYSLF